MSPAVEAATLSTAIIPGGAWLEPTGAADAEGRPLVRKATRGGLAGLVNGPDDVPASDGSTPEPVLAYPPWGVVWLAVSPSDTLTATSTLGPKPGDWLCRVGQPGFRPVGPAFGGLVPAVADGGGSGAGGATRPVKLTAAASTTPGGYEAARLVAFAGVWADATPVTDVWLVELNGGTLPDPTAGRRYLAWDSGADATVAGDTRRVYVADVPPGLMTDWKCQDNVPLLTHTPVGVS